MEHLSPEADGVLLVSETKLITLFNLSHQPVIRNARLDNIAV